MTYAIARVIDYVFDIFIILIFVDVIGSWLIYARVRLPDWLYSIFRVVNSITGVVLNPIRRLIPSMGGLDISPLIALGVIYVLRLFVTALLR